MLEELKDLLESGDYAAARQLANRLVEAGEDSELFWILNATLYQIEGYKEGEYACISRGLQKNAANYELYYMLGCYYKERNINQAYLCFEQALYYCTDENDRPLMETEIAYCKEQPDYEVHPVSIVILSYNIAEILKNCIAGIRENNDPSTYELVVVDNASTDGITDWLRQQEDIVLQCNDTNLGYARGCNQGIELAAPENDILLLNNDTIVPPNAVFWLRMGLYERKTVGATGPITNYAGNNQALANELDSVDAYLELARQIHVPIAYPYENKLWLIGFAMLIKRAALNQAGLLDTRYEWGNYEDNDYGLKLSANGYECLLCYNSFIYHYGSLNMTKDLKKYEYYMQENRQKLIDKWGFQVPYYSNARIDLIENIHRSPKEHIRVLEVGCGSGATLSRIRYQFPNAEVYGIELMEEVAKAGRFMGNIITGNIETMELPYEKQYFDYILFGDVLEHLRDPAAVLCKLGEYLADGGQVIASIPNIMNISVIVGLLHGDFTYQDSGLLDRTHIHFFTYKEILRMFAACHYQIRDVKGRAGREAMQEDEEALIEAVYALPGIEPREQFEVYQYLVVAEKIPKGEV